MRGAGWAVRQTAKMYHVSVRSLEYGKEIKKKGIPELAAMMRDGDLKPHHAVLVARLSHAEQLKIVQSGSDGVRAAAWKLQHENERQRALDLGAIDFDVHLAGNLDEVAETLCEGLTTKVACALAHRILAARAEGRRVVRYLKWIEDEASRNFAGQDDETKASTGGSR